MNKKSKIIIAFVTTTLILITISTIVYNLATSDKRKQTINEKKIIQQLPYETDEFKIEHTGSMPGGTYTISLYAILNRDSQLPQYKLDLKNYKNNAILWLKTNEVDPNDLNIIWLPEEAEKI